MAYSESYFLKAVNQNTLIDVSYTEKCIFPTYG